MTAVSGGRLQICELDRIRDDCRKELRVRRDQDRKVRNRRQLLRATLELT
jgi:hypothetical protein